MHVLPECVEQFCGATRVEPEGGLRDSPMGLKPLLSKLPASDKLRRRIQRT